MRPGFRLSAFGFRKSTVPMTLALLVPAGGCFKSECVEAHECPSGRICYGGACVAFNSAAQCAVEADCRPGLRCANHRCLVVRVACADAGGCRAGESCIAQHCVESSMACTDAVDCTSGRVCQDNRCITNGDCNDANDCPRGQECSSHRCISVEVACDADDECDYGVCDDGRCVES